MLLDPDLATSVGLQPADIDFLQPSCTLAPALIGVTLLINGVGGRIVETEAYDELDPASHTFSGPNVRNAAMFGPPGCAYVYRSYGIHWCLNFVCQEAGHGAGVLIRAIEPTHGLDVMRARRSQQAERLLCAGPGRLGQALAVGPEMAGRPLTVAPFALLQPVQPEAIALVIGPRIGISKAREQPWRFGLAQSAWLSRPFSKLDPSA